MPTHLLAVVITGIPIKPVANPAAIIIRITSTGDRRRPLQDFLGSKSDWTGGGKVASNSAAH